MNRKLAINFSLVVLSLLFHGPNTRAQTAVINFTDRGWYTETGYHQPGTLNYFVGDSGEANAAGGADYRNYFVFNLAGLPRPIASATLALYVPGPAGPAGYISVDPSENYELHDVTTPIDALMNGTGGIAAHTDLGTGVVYGSRLMTIADDGKVIEIALNSSAIAAMNSANGLFAIGGSITTLDSVSDKESTFARTNTGTEITELRIGFVPEPTGAAFLAFGAMIFGYRRRCMCR